MAVAPIDATASFDADGETYRLQLNFRTIAAAEDLRPDCLTSFGRGKPTVSGMAALIWAFAQPAHPNLTQDEAFALAMRHGQAAGEALGECLAKAADVKGADGADAPAADPQSTKAGSTP